MTVSEGRRPALRLVRSSGPEDPSTRRPSLDGHRDLEDRPAVARRTRADMQTSVLISMTGSLDRVSGTEMLHQVGGLLSLGLGTIFVDLSGVLVLDGSGLGCLLRAMDDANACGGGVALLDASDAVKEVLRQRDEVRRTPAPRGDGPTGTRPEHPVHHRRALGAPVGASPIPTA